jgi:hypothetical protein
MLMIVNDIRFGYQTYNLDNLWTGLSQMGWENEV